MALTPEERARLKALVSDAQKERYKRAKHEARYGRRPRRPRVPAQPEPASTRLIDILASRR